MASHDERLAYRLADREVAIPVAEDPAYVVPFRDVHRDHLRLKAVVDSGATPEAVNRESAILVSVFRGVVALAIRVSDHEDDSADATTMADAESCGAAAIAVADCAAAVVPMDCANAWDCRLRDWHDCYDRTNCPSLRGPSSVQNASGPAPRTSRAGPWR